MTPLQLQLITDLRGVTFPAYTSQKRFAQSMIAAAQYKPELELTEKQAAYLIQIHHRFRRQHRKETYLHLTETHAEREPQSQTPDEKPNQPRISMSDMQEADQIPLWDEKPQMATQEGE